MYGHGTARKWYGNPQVATRVNREIYQAVNQSARTRGISRSDLFREIILKWFHDENKILGTPRPSTTPLPVTAPRRQDTGMNAPIRELQAIDQEREEQRDKGKGFAD